MQDSTSNNTTVLRAVKMLFTPSIQLMGRLPFIWKFIVAGSIFMAPLIFVLFHYVVSLNGQVEFSHREVEGISLVRIANRQMLDITSASLPLGETVEGAMPSVPTPQRLLDRLEATANPSPVELSMNYHEPISRALQSFRTDLQVSREQLNGSDAPDIDALRCSLIDKVQPRMAPSETTRI